jgi:hypothetical protein
LDGKTFLDIRLIWVNFFLTLPQLVQVGLLCFQILIFILLVLTKLSFLTQRGTRKSWDDDWDR